MSNYGENRETTLNKITSLSDTDLIRVVKDSASRNITYANLVTTLNGSLNKLVSVTTTAINYIATSSNDAILCDVTTAGLTVTLPSASANTGKILYIKKIDGSTNDVTVQADGSDLIDGSATATLSGSGGARPGVELLSDGSNWYILNA